MKALPSRGERGSAVYTERDKLGNDKANLGSNSASNLNGPSRQAETTTPYQIRASTITDMRKLNFSAAAA